MTETRDVIARQLVIGGNPDGYITGTSNPVWTVYKPEANAILAALAAEGLVIVPREPTDAMVATALEHEYSRQPLPSDVEFVYRAMLAAYGGDDG